MVEKLAVLGVSDTDICGVRDHAALLADALARDGVSHSSLWLRRSQGSRSASRTEFRAWTRELAAELHSTRPDAVVLHYSVFSFSHRGLPIYARPVLSTLQSTRIPVVVVLHEFAYQWMYGGWRGNVWALTQRAALIDVMRVCAAALVTTDMRADWLSSRPWLPRRPVAFAPVFSNLPAPRGGARTDANAPVVGLFGYAYQGAETAIVLDAVVALAQRGVDVQLRLLGSGGSESSAGRAWLAAARARGVERRLSFSGTLAAQELSDALAECDVLLSAFTPGPSSRKGTLAASLASGAPVVAIDGPRGWSELVESGAIRVVAPSSQALAAAVAELLDDRDAREALGARGRAFAEQSMGVARTARVMRALLDELG